MQVRPLQPVSRPRSGAGHILPPATARMNPQGLLNPFPDGRETACHLLRHAAGV